MGEQKKLYSIKWPLDERHRTESVSGVLVENNLHHQFALHFYNEVRELEREVAYDEEGKNLNTPRGVDYMRHIVQTILLSEASAINLRDVLNSLFPTGNPNHLS